MNIIYAYAEEVATECFIVVACVGEGKVMYHNGPENYAYFSKDQAQSVAQKVNFKRVIDTQYWNNGSFCDMSIRDMEDGFWTGNHE